MAISINGKEYDETKLDDKIKNSVVQVQNHQNRMRQLQAEFDNCKIIVEYHSKYLTDNLPKDAEVKEEAKTTLE
jgi:hypothetical protein